MIVSCECNNCLLKDLCTKRNYLVQDFESNWGDKFMYVTLKCKHLHPNVQTDGFDCSKCKNKPICAVQNHKQFKPEEYLWEINYEVKTKCIGKLPADAFHVILCCKGYMPVEYSSKDPLEG